MLLAAHLLQASLSCSLPGRKHASIQGYLYSHHSMSRRPLQPPSHEELKNCLKVYSSSSACHVLFTNLQLEFVVESPLNRGLGTLRAGEVDGTSLICMQ